MRIRIRIPAGLVSGKNSGPLLLAVATIALVVPGSDVALSQTATGASGQIPLFTAIDLNPDGFTSSLAFGISGGQQVGVGSGPATGGQAHALLWRGSADSVVDLHPGRFKYSWSYATCGAQQVGEGDGHALLWRGSAASVVDLHTPRFEGTRAFATSCGEQVGRGYHQCCVDDLDHALLWRGNATSVVDLNPSGVGYSEANGTSGQEQVGFAAPYHAVLWHGNARSMVDLHPKGFRESEAFDTSGGQQVGSGSTGDSCAHDRYGPPSQPCYSHALLWHGSASSVVDLNPRGFMHSEAFRVCGGQQVGRGYGPATKNALHALLWRGSAASVVDLHDFLPPGFLESQALGIDAAGNIVGVGYASSDPWARRIYPEPSAHAFLWKPSTPRRGAC